MKRPVFTGAAVAIITPMNTDGSVNYDELGRIIDDQIAHSTDAIVICGTTGESPTLTDEELALYQKVKATYLARTKTRCTGCKYCMPCPAGVDIPGNFAIWNEGSMYDIEEKARKAFREKQEAGAAFFITQLFFENDSFYRFLEKKNHAGITLPVCTGIMPITSAKQLGTTVTLSGSSVPKELADIIATYGENPEDMRKAGIDYAIRQILDLKQHGVDGIHIYSMNKPKTTRTIVEAIR